MKILGQHREFDGPATYSHPPTLGVVTRKVEIEVGERVSVKIRNKTTGEEEEIFGYFMPGVLTLEWTGGAKLN